MKDFIMKAVKLKNDILELETEIERKKQELSSIGDSVEVEYGIRDEPLIVKIGDRYYTVFREVYGNQVTYKPTEVLE